MCCFHIFLFRYGTLFAYTSKNILLIVGIILSAFIVQVFEMSGCSVVRDKRSSLFTTSKRLRTFQEPGHPVTASVYRDMIKGTLQNGYGNRMKRMCLSWLRISGRGRTCF